MNNRPTKYYIAAMIGVYAVVSFLSIQMQEDLQRLSKIGAVVLCVITLIIIIYHDHNKKQKVIPQQEVK